MAIFKNLRNLEFDNLQEGDIIMFLGIKYRVLNNSLVSFFDDCNDKIFIVLGITDKYSFCGIHYGYPPVGDYAVPNQFPNSKKNDLGALTRVAKAIMKLCEK